MRGRSYDIADDRDRLTAVCLEVYDLWLEVAGDSPPPTLKQFSLELIPPKVLPWCSIVDLVETEGGTDYFFRFWGSERVKLVGGELTGSLFSELEVKETRETAFATFDDMFTRPRPSVWDMPIVTNSGRAVVLSFLRLPLQNADAKIAHVFSVLDQDSLTVSEYKGFGTEPPLHKIDNF